jgi:hypothetical protein
LVVCSVASSRTATNHLIIIFETPDVGIIGRAAVGISLLLLLLLTIAGALMPASAPTETWHREEGVERTHSLEDGSGPSA